MCDCDCDRPEIGRYTTPLARKKHVCCECHQTIKPGERYHSYFGVWDGYAETFKWCAQCQALHETLREAGLCACIGGELFEVAFETNIACPVAWRADLIEDMAEAR